MKILTCEMYAVFACTGGTFGLTIISLYSNANNVGDLKIPTSKFFFFYCRVSKGKITMCCTRISHVYRFDIHLKCDK